MAVAPLDRKLAMTMAGIRDQEEAERVDPAVEPVVVGAYRPTLLLPGYKVRDMPVELGSGVVLGVPEGAGALVAKVGAEMRREVAMAVLDYHSTFPGRSRFTPEEEVEVFSISAETRQLESAVSVVEVVGGISPKEIRSGVLSSIHHRYRKTVFRIQAAVVVEQTVEVAPVHNQNRPEVVGLVS